MRRCTVHNGRSRRRLTVSSVRVVETVTYVTSFGIPERCWRTVAPRVLGSRYECDIVVDVAAARTRRWCRLKFPVDRFTSAAAHEPPDRVHAHAHTHTHTHTQSTHVNIFATPLPLQQRLAHSLTRSLTLALARAHCCRRHHTQPRAGETTAPAECEISPYPHTHSYTHTRTRLLIIHVVV